VIEGGLAPFDGGVPLKGACPLLPVMEENNINILIVEDNPADARLVLEMLRQCNGSSFETSHVERLEKALRVLEKKEFDAVLMDLNLPDTRGLGGLERIIAIQPHIPVIVLTGMGDEDTGIQALHKSAADYLVKGQLDENLLYRSIRYSIERKRAEREIHKINAELARHTAEVQSANEALTDSRRAALNIMEDEVASRQRAEELNDKLLKEIAEREKAEEEIKKIARFPAENPFPVLRLSGDGTILYSNKPGQVLLEQWDCEIGSKVPNNWYALIRKSLRYLRPLVEKIQCGSRLFSFAIAPVTDGQYVNLYGRDVTIQEQIKDVLRKSRDELDRRVKERTAELDKTVVALQKEMEQRERAQEIARAERQRFNEVLETLPVYICLLNADYYMPFANRVFRELFDYSPDKKCYEFLFNRKEPCEDCETYKVLKTNKPHHWQWAGPDGQDYDVYDFPFTDNDGAKLILEMGIDVTERNKAEARSRITNILLGLFAQKTSRNEYLDSVVEQISNWSGCKCVGIRLANSDGYIPYESWVGFSDEFLAAESMISLKTGACLCVRAVTQKKQSQDIPLSTMKGSFCCNNTSEFINKLTSKNKSLYRGICMKHGFASLAIIPIRYRANIIGLIHIADKGENKIPIDTVEFLEDMAVLIGEAVHRFDIEDSLRLNEKRLIEAQRIARLGNWEWDITVNKLLWSDEVYRIFGLEPGLFEVTYNAFLSYVHPDDRKLIESSINNALYAGIAYNINHRIIKPDSSERIINERAEVVYDSDNKPVKMIGTVHDITEQKKAEEEIRKNQSELRALAAELQLAEERERRRIAQDLHDSIGQILAFSGRELKGLQKSLSDEPANLLQEVIDQLGTAVKQTRSLSFDLSPSILYDLGFEAAVEDLVDKMSEQRHIQCSFESCSSPKPLTDDVKVLLYRSIRELLINAAKHAKADLIKVSLLRSSSDIYVKVEDDGRGFNTDLLKDESKKTKGFGLFSIRERLNHIGGYLKIESEEGKGTKAILTAPLDVDAETERS
jgi:PAS domain S-box-containing protein